MKKITKILEIASSIAVVIVSVVVLGFLARIVFWEQPGPRFSPGLEKGMTLAKVGDVDYGSSELTLLIALRTTCSYCEASLPLYRKLIDAGSRGPKPLHVIAVFSERSEEVANYLKAKDVEIDFVPEVNFDGLHISGTPTMILVNRDGAVKDFWIGKLPDSELDQFFQQLVAENRSSR